MFKRRFGHRPRGKKLLTRASANRTFKHAVREKVISLNVKCSEICADPLATCPSASKHILIANGELFAPTATGFSDAIRITRIEGTLWMKPDYSHVGDAGVNCQDVSQIQDHPTIFRMGLLKSRVQQALGGVPVAVNPLADGPSPFALSDAADSQFLKTWDHLFQVTKEVDCGFTTNGVICCGQVTPVIVPPSAAGTWPGYVIPADQCFPCEGQVAGTTAVVRNKLPGYHPFHINFRRAIVVKENETLDLWYAWELMIHCEETGRIGIPPLAGSQPPMLTVGHVFLTVEH
jgi:hypothetical protein